MMARSSVTSAGVGLWAKCWYVLVFCVLLTIGAVFLLALLAYPALQQFLWSQDFLTTTCGVLSADRRGDVRCENNDGTSTRESSFPCVVVMVNVTANAEGRSVISTLYESRKTLEASTQCSVYTCSREMTTNELVVDDFLQAWPPGYNFSCLYNPTAPLRVFPAAGPNLVTVVNLILWPAAVVAFSLVLGFLYLLRSWRRGKTPCKPPHCCAEIPTDRIGL